jgi:hypothetical protein
MSDIKSFSREQMLLLRDLLEIYIDDPIGPYPVDMAQEALKEITGYLGIEPEKRGFE